jgi:serine/threonine protein kinase
LGATGNKLLGVKEFRYRPKINPKNGQRYTSAILDDPDWDPMMDEMDTMRRCKCELKIHDVLQIDKKAYCIMDYMDGTLREYVKWKTDKKFSRSNVSQAGGRDKDLIKKRDRQVGRFILKELTVDLKNCHMVRYIHKDIKPDNVLVKKNCVALVDYGFASPSYDKRLAGTQNYFPASSWRKRSVDKSTDIYNLGLTWLYYFVEYDLMDVIRYNYCDHIDDVSLVNIVKNNMGSISFYGQDGTLNNIYHKASEIFSYFYNNYYDKKGEFNSKYFVEHMEESRTVSDRRKKFLTQWQDKVDYKLGRAREADPELYAFVWEKMLNQDPNNRAQIREVDRKISTLFRKNPNTSDFNSFISHPNNLMKRKQIEKAFKKANDEYKEEYIKKKGKTQFKW